MMVVDYRLYAVLTPALKAAKIADLSKLNIPGTAIKYGNFISTLISFIIIAFALFIIVKALNAAKKKEDAVPEPVVPPPANKEEILLAEIRDILKNQK